MGVTAEILEILPAGRSNKMSIIKSDPRTLRFDKGKQLRA